MNHFRTYWSFRAPTSFPVSLRWGNIQYQVLREPGSPSAHHSSHQEVLIYVGKVKCDSPAGTVSLGMIWKSLKFTLRILSQSWAIYSFSLFFLWHKLLNRQPSWPRTTESTDLHWLCEFGVLERTLARGWAETLNLYLLHHFE